MSKENPNYVRLSIEGTTSDNTIDVSFSIIGESGKLLNTICNLMHKDPDFGKLIMDCATAYTKREISEHAENIMHMLKDIKEGSSNNNKHSKFNEDEKG